MTPLVELDAVSEELAQFIALSHRVVKLAALSRRTRAPRQHHRTIDQVLESVVLPTWSIGTGGDVQLTKSAEIMGTLRQQMQANTSPYAIESYRQELEDKIDATVMSLYGLSAEEQQFLFQLKSE